MAEKVTAPPFSIDAGASIGHIYYIKSAQFLGREPAMVDLKSWVHVFLVAVALCGASVAYAEFGSMSDSPHTGDDSSLTDTGVGSAPGSTLTQPDIDPSIYKNCEDLNTEVAKIRKDHHGIVQIWKTGGVVEVSPKGTHCRGDHSLNNFRVNIKNGKTCDLGVVCLTDPADYQN